MRTESRRRRRSHDRADRQARLRLIGGVVTLAVAVVAALGGYWWYSSQVPARDGAPNWFPDSRALIYAAESGDGRADIFRMDLDGGGRARLTDHPATDTAPAVSPDGSRIAFESDRDGNFEIYVMDVSGRRLTRLTRDAARDRSPAWSPDGRRLAFTSDRGNGVAADLYVMNADGSAVERLTTGRAHWAPQFSPDGGRVAVQVDRDVAVIDLAGGAPRRLTVDPLNGMNPTWSPDGRRLAFVSTRGGRAELFTMNADGSSPRVLVTMAAGHAIDPRWSPDGRRIAYVLVPDAAPSTDGQSDAGSVQAIYTIDVASGVVERVSR